MGEPKLPEQCAECRHFQGVNPDTDKLCCEAYPEQIPTKIQDGAVDHTKPYRGDHGIQFEAVDPA